MIKVNVTDYPFCARADGRTNDRQAIQQAIDYVYENGGGEVILGNGRTFYSSGIILRSGVTLIIGEGTVLQQTCSPEGYVKPAGDGYVPYTPVKGQNFSEEIKWSHNWYINYPFIFAPEGSHHFAVRGKGTVRMMEVTDPEEIYKLCPIGFYRCSNFGISDITITNYHGYAMMPFTCRDGLVSNVRILNSNHGNGDGICLMNSSNIRITGCKMDTGDDSVYIFSSYRDPRRSEWWNSDNPEPSVNIEIDHNSLRSNHCKAFGMILWGIECPDPEKIEVRNLYVHDNYFETMGNWLWNPYSDKGGHPPVTDVRFENNVIDGIESNFFETVVGNMSYYHSMTCSENGSFAGGRVFWSMRGDATEIRRPGESGDNEKGYGSVLNTGDGKNCLFQGLWLDSGRKIAFRSRVMTEGGPCRLFVRNAETGESVFEEKFTGTEWCEKFFNIEVPVSANYHVGIESACDDGSHGKITDFCVESRDNAFGYEDICYDRGKILYRYSERLFQR